MTRENKEYNLKEIFEEMELELISSFYRNLVKHQMEQLKLGFSWEMWQSAMLRNLEEYRRNTLNLISGYNKEIEETIKEVLDKSYDKGIKNVEKIVTKIENSPNIGPVDKKPPAEQNFFGMNKKKLDALISSTTHDFKEAQKAIFRQTDDIYRQTIFKTEFQMSSGAISLDKAIDLSIKDFLKRGIDCIIYKNGRRVNIATYAEMALRTASQRATFLGEGAKRDEYGVHLIVISSHANACELCLPWQGEILIDDVFSHPSETYIEEHRQYKLLSTAIKAGLLHPNCRHTLITYFEGVTRIPKKQDEKEALKNYHLEQYQRKLERKIRSLKRLAVGSVDKDEKKKYSLQLRASQKEMRDFLKTNPQFKRNSGREQIKITKNQDRANEKLEYAKDDTMIFDFVQKKKRILNSASTVDKYIDLSSIEDDEALLSIVRKDYEMFPKEALEFISKHVKIRKSAGDSTYYDGDLKTIFMNPHVKKEGILAHELGHAFVDINDLYKNKELRGIMIDVLNNSKKIFKEYQGESYVVLKSDLFIRVYQGRTYIKEQDYINPRLKLHYTNLEEYISVGYETFVTNPQLLYNRDRRLYDFFAKGEAYHGGR